MDRLLALDDSGKAPGEDRSMVRGDDCERVDGMMSRYNKEEGTARPRERGTYLMNRIE